MEMTGERSLGKDNWQKSFAQIASARSVNMVYHLSEPSVLQLSHAPDLPEEQCTLAADSSCGFNSSFSASFQGFSLLAGMAEYVPQPPSTWPTGPQPPHSSAACPLEPVDLGVSEQQPPPEQPPSSPELGEDEEVTSPPDPDVPYPDLAPVVFFCLKQTTSPRNWCIKMVCNPYPF